MYKSNEILAFLLWALFHILGWHVFLSRLRSLSLSVSLWLSRTFSNKDSLRKVDCKACKPCDQRITSSNPRNSWKSFSWQSHSPRPVSKTCTCSLCFWNRAWHYIDFSWIETSNPDSYGWMCYMYERCVCLLAACITVYLPWWLFWLCVVWFFDEVRQRLILTASVTISGLDPRGTAIRFPITPLGEKSSAGTNAYVFLIARICLSLSVLIVILRITCEQCILHLSAPACPPSVLTHRNIFSWTFKPHCFLFFCTFYISYVLPYSIFFSHCPN